MLCFLYILLIIFSIVGLLGFLSFIKILRIWHKPSCTPYLLVCLVTAIFIGVYTSFLGNVGDIFDVSGESDRRGALGTLGDYFGGMLNPILAFLSFIVLVAALVYQSKQLEQNEKALEETRKAIQQNEKALEQNATALKINNTELANSTKQLALATQAHKEIEKTQKLQQFESLFFSLLTHLTNKIDRLNEKNVIDRLHDDIYKRTFDANLWDKKEYISLLELIYTIFTNINFDDLSDLTEDEKKKYEFKYVDILRSVIPEKVLHFLIHDLTRDQGNPNLQLRKEKLEKFPFFENLSLDGMDYKTKYWLLNSILYFNPSIFGEHHEWKSYRENYFSQIFEKGCIRSLEWCLFNLFKNFDLLHSDVTEFGVVNLLEKNILIQFYWIAEGNLDIGMKFTDRDHNLKDFQLKKDKLVLYFSNFYPSSGKDVESILYISFQKNRNIIELQKGYDTDFSTQD